MPEHLLISSLIEARSPGLRVSKGRSEKEKEKKLDVWPALENSKARQQLKSTIFPAQEKRYSKRRRVDRRRPSTLLHYSPSSGSKTPRYNGTKPVTTAHDFASSGLPNHKLPPPDQDNTRLWAAIMAKTKEDRASRTASTNPSISVTYGGRGTLGYQEMLFKIGIELPRSSDNPWFKTTTDPRTYAGLQTQEKVSKYVVEFNSDQAREFASCLKEWLDETASEADIRQYLAEKLFPEPEPRIQRTANWAPTDKPGEYDLKRKLEQAHQFQHHDVTELHQNIFSFPIVRLSPGERDKGLSASKNTLQTVPAETDLRGRCDIVFGLTYRCMNHELRKATAYLPGYHRSSGICSIFLRVELKKSIDDHKAALHQFAMAAYLELLARVRMARPDGSSVLDSSDSSGHLRHYGYVICKQTVHIWEMGVERYHDAMSSDDTLFDNKFLRFPCKKLRELDLFEAEDVQEFSQWHAMILAWGLHVYSRQYLRDANLSLRSTSTTMSYKDAVGPGACELVQIDLAGNIHIPAATPLPIITSTTLNTTGRSRSPITRTRKPEGKPASPNRVNKRGRKRKGSTPPKRVSQRIKGIKKVQAEV